MRNRTTHSTDRGFTIVELLIVIVVIAILAAISIVAFTGVQQRAKNSAKVTAVSEAIKLIKLHKTGTDRYPVESATTMCLTVDNKCTTYDGNAVNGTNAPMSSALSEYGRLAANTGDNVNGTYYGVSYLYNASLTYNSASTPVLIVFWLDGVNQSCQVVSGVPSVRDSGTPNVMVSGNNSRADTGTNQTRCYLLLQ